jgi:hypothetical protein
MKNMETQNSCKLNHSAADVEAKLKDMFSLLPQDIAEWLTNYVNEERSQEELNSIFHLLKKYDLADISEQERRNTAFRDRRDNL